MGKAIDKLEVVFLVSAVLIFLAGLEIYSEITSDFGAQGEFL